MICLAFFVPMFALASGPYVNGLDIRAAHCLRGNVSDELLDCESDQERWPDFQQTDGLHCLVHSVALLPEVELPPIFTKANRFLTAPRHSTAEYRLFAIEHPPKSLG